MKYFYQKYNFKNKFWIFLTWQTADCFFFVWRLLREPEVVEPLDDFVLDVVRHATHSHVRFHAVQFRWKESKNQIIEENCSFLMCPIWLTLFLIFSVISLAYIPSSIQCKSGFELPNSRMQVFSLNHWTMASRLINKNKMWDIN